MYNQDCMRETSNEDVLSPIELSSGSWWCYWGSHLLTPHVGEPRENVLPLEDPHNQASSVRRHMHGRRVTALKCGTCPQRFQDPRLY
jgi:hypothetical protein